MLLGLLGRGGTPLVDRPGGVQVLGALVGASVVRILGAAVLPVSVPAAVLVAAGAVLGGAATHRGLGRLDRTPAGLASGLAVFACAAFLPMYGAVAWGVVAWWTGWS